MPRPRNPTPCAAPGCQRQSRAGGLCHAHYQQRLRGQKLRAIEARVARVRLSSVRVSERCAARLLEAGRDTGDPSSVAASRILEAWALGLLVALPQPDAARYEETECDAGCGGVGCGSCGR